MARFDVVPEGDAARLWLFGVARHVLLKGFDRRRSLTDLASRLADELRITAHLTADDSVSQVVEAALDRLPERDRELLTLSAWENLTPSEIAVVVGSSANVIRIRLHRARRRFRDALSSPIRTDHEALPHPLSSVELRG
jgi:RNA polymerase sigma-70 factor, ECF subfamily